MSRDLCQAFAKAKAEHRAAFVTFITAGFPDPSMTVDILLALERGGADIIELGIPFSESVADGPTIQNANAWLSVVQIALSHGTNVDVCLNMVHQARKYGLKVPVVFMSYYSPIHEYGEERVVKDCRLAGVNGFILPDIPQEAALAFRNFCSIHGLSYVPLITPTSLKNSFSQEVQVKNTFIYVASHSGVTGVSPEMNKNIPVMLEKIRRLTDAPLAVGFGVSTREHFDILASYQADGVVMGSRIIIEIKKAVETGEDIVKTVDRFIASICGRSYRLEQTTKIAPMNKEIQYFKTTENVPL